MEEGVRPLPRPTPETLPYWEGARAGRLRLQRCGQCAAWLFYPRSHCPHCLSDRLTWVDSAGEGVIYTYSVHYRAAHPAFKAALPYVVAVVELSEGVRLLANLPGARPEQVYIGAPVRVCFERLNDEITLPQFQLQSDGGE